MTKPVSGTKLITMVVSGIVSLKSRIGIAQIIGGNGMYEKHKRYREKMRKEGKCPHCGKPCLPYSECATRRQQRKVTYTCNRLVLIGAIEKTSDSKYRYLENGKPLKKLRCFAYKIQDDDSRLYPRNGTAYIDVKKLCIDVLEEEGKPLTTEELEDRLKVKIAQIRVKRITAKPTITEKACLQNTAQENG